MENTHDFTTNLIISGLGWKWAQKTQSWIVRERERERERRELGDSRESFTLHVQEIKLASDREEKTWGPKEIGVSCYLLVEEGKGMVLFWELLDARKSRAALSNQVFST